MEGPMIEELAMKPKNDHESRVEMIVKALNEEDKSLFVQLSFHHGGSCGDNVKIRMKRML
jgi:hypothetical protein